MIIRGVTPVDQQISLPLVKRLLESLEVILLLVIEFEVVEIKRAVNLPKIPSKLAKFRLQIVENRLEFQSQISPVEPDRREWRPGRLPCVPNTRS